MKYLLQLLLFTLAFNVFADQRIDSDTGNCHIAPDPNDDDAEVDTNCVQLNANVNRYLDANGTRKAQGSQSGKVRFPVDNQLVKPESFIPNSSGDFVLVGSDNTRYISGESITAANTACRLVRTNFQENTGSDDQNQTQYSTNDWDLTVKWLGYEDINGNTIPGFDMTDLSFDLNNDGIVGFDDYVLFTKKYPRTGSGIWYVTNNCRNATE